MLIFTKYSMCFTSDVQIVPAKNCCLAASAGQISAVSETAWEDDASTVQIVLSTLWHKYEKKILFSMLP